MSRNVYTLLSPALLESDPLQGSIVVVIDAFRATSTICSALVSGARCVRPVRDAEDARAFAGNGVILAGERSGIQLKGFDLGNSPLSMQQAQLKDKEVVLTTTNGTESIHAARSASSLFMASFLNRSALCDALDAMEQDIYLLCAGWKGKVNLEDSLVAGAICHALTGDYHFDDASLMVQSAYVLAMDHLEDHLKQSSHYQRLVDVGAEEDISYCCQLDILNIVPIYRNGLIVPNDRP